jgi:hypothetical protein
MPGADDAGDVGWPIKAQLGERLERARVVVFAGEDQVTDAAGKPLLVLEQFRIALLDPAEHGDIGLAETRGVGIAHHQRDAGEFGLAFRQGVALLVAYHLDAVFDIAQIPVAFHQQPGGRGVDPARTGQRHQHLVGAAQAELRHPAAGNQLLGLDEELDLANAAAPEFDIVALDRNVAKAAMGMDLALDRMNVGNGGEIEIFAEDEGHQVLEEPLARTMSPATARALIRRRAPSSGRGSRNS